MFALLEVGCGLNLARWLRLGGGGGGNVVLRKRRREGGVFDVSLSAALEEMQTFPLLTTVSPD